MYVSFLLKHLGIDINIINRIQSVLPITKYIEYIHHRCLLEPIIFTRLTVIIVMDFLHLFLLALNIQETMQFITELSSAERSINNLNCSIAYQ